MGVGVEARALCLDIRAKPDREDRGWKGQAKSRIENKGSGSRNQVAIEVISYACRGPVEVVGAENAPESSRS